MGATLLGSAHLKVSHDFHCHLASLQEHVSFGYFLHNADLHPSICVMTVCQVCCLCAQDAMYLAEETQ